MKVFSRFWENKCIPSSEFFFLVTIIVGMSHLPGGVLGFLLSSIVLLQLRRTLFQSMPPLHRDTKQLIGATEAAEAADAMKTVIASSISGRRRGSC